MKIFIIDLESVQTRYTCEWKTGIPEAIERQAKGNGYTVDTLWNPTPESNWPDVDVTVCPVEGEQISTGTTEGAFLDFSATNVYKSSQIIQIAKLVSADLIENGDKVLVTDSWNPGVIQLRYMFELLGIEAEIHAIWHAGSYDPYDFLGRIIQDKRWSYNFEESLIQAIHKNYFASQFHIDMLLDTIEPDIENNEIERKLIRAGQPHDYMVKTLNKYKGYPKENIILFPHRLAPEKQPEIFRELAKALPEYEWVICQEQKLSKNEYHDLLARAKMVFSANMQETLGISAMEGTITGTMPLVPNRLSYKEMYVDQFKYPSYWTSGTSFNIYKNQLVDKIKWMIENYNSDDIQNNLVKQEKLLLDNYLSGSKMINELLKQTND